MECKVVLASKSPRRKQLLEQIGVEFDIWPSTCEEITQKSLPEEVCIELCKLKAMDVASQIKTYQEEHPELVTPQDILVIGADTIVSCEGEILGKPHDEADAKKMLCQLSDNMNSVYTGVCFIFISKDGRAGEYSFYEKTDVYFYPIPEDDIDKYIESGEPMDKAGAYGIQGVLAKFVKSVDGDFYNVVGLPLSRIWHELSKLGIVCYNSK